MQTVTKPARLEQSLGWIALLLLLIGCLLVLRPFASALLWAVVSLLAVRYRLVEEWAALNKEVPNET